MLFAFGHVFWILERRENSEQFDPLYFKVSISSSRVVAACTLYSRERKGLSEALTQPMSKLDAESYWMRTGFD